MKQTKMKFVLYTNPNNVTNFAYTANGAVEVREILKSSKDYPGSYKILMQGKGTANEIAEAQRMFNYYKFV